jgi:hypothetical protein
MLQFGSCDTDDAASKYLSTEWDAAFFDELTTFPLHMYRMIESRVGRRAAMPWSVAGGTNPVGIGAGWVKTLWIDKDPHADEAPKYDPVHYQYVPATIADNPYLSLDYADKLESLPSEALRQAYRYGSWEFLEGQFFGEFRTEKQGKAWHVLTEMPRVNGQPVTDLGWLEWFRSIDWGIGNLTVVGWYCCLPSGRVIKVFERTWREFISGPALGREIVSFTRKHIKGRVRYTVADPKMFSREGSLGIPVAEDLAKAGVSCTPADNARELGWAQVKTWLGTVGDDGAPLFQIYRPGCPHTVKTLPTLVSKKGNPDDLDKGQDDHCADETRYALMSRPSATKVRARMNTDATVSPTTTSVDFRRFLRKQDRRGLDLKARFSPAWH